MGPMMRPGSGMGGMEAGDREVGWAASAEAMDFADQAALKSDSNQ